MEELAEEVVVVHVFSRLEVQDLLSLSLVSTTVKRLAGDFTLWKRLLLKHFGPAWKDYQPTKDEQTGMVDWRLEFLLHMLIQTQMCPPGGYLFHAAPVKEVCHHCFNTIEKGTLIRVHNQTAQHSLGYEHASCVLQRDFPFPSTLASRNGLEAPPWQRRGLKDMRFGKAKSYTAQQQIALWVVRGMRDEDIPSVLGPSSARWWVS
ncbi:hypothetical protein QOT17_014458 [Balamuthia mandrillaris]